MGYEQSDFNGDEAIAGWTHLKLGGNCTVLRVSFATPYSEGKGKWCPVPTSLAERAQRSGAGRGRPHPGATCIR
jgi:hypothetical protein